MKNITIFYVAIVFIFIAGTSSRAQDKALEVPPVTVNVYTMGGGKSDLAEILKALIITKLQDRGILVQSGENNGWRVWIIVGEESRSGHAPISIHLSLRSRIDKEFCARYEKDTWAVHTEMMSASIVNKETANIFVEKNIYAFIGPFGSKQE